MTMVVCKYPPEKEQRKRHHIIMVSSKKKKKKKNLGLYTAQHCIIKNVAQYANL